MNLNSCGLFCLVFQRFLRKREAYQPKCDQPKNYNTRFTSFPAPKTRTSPRKPAPECLFPARVTSNTESGLQKEEGRWERRKKNREHEKESNKESKTEGKRTRREERERGREKGRRKETAKGRKGNGYTVQASGTRATLDLAQACWFTITPFLSLLFIKEIYHGGPIIPQWPLLLQQETFYLVSLHPLGPSTKSQGLTLGCLPLRKI